MHNMAAYVQELFEEQQIAFGYYLKPEAALEERAYQELPPTAAQLTPLLATYLDAYNNRFNTNLELGMQAISANTRCEIVPQLHGQWYRLHSMDERCHSRLCGL